MQFEKEINKIPFLRYLIPFIIGVHLHTILPSQVNKESMLLITGGVLFTVYILIRNKLNKPSITWINGIIINTLLVIGGFLLANTRYQLPEYISDNTSEQTCIAYISEEPITSGTQNKYLATLCNYKTDSGWIKTSGKVILFIPQNNNSARLTIGSSLVFQAKLQSYSKKGNPEEFNYQRFLLNRDIYGYAYIGNNKWINLNKTVNSPKLYSIRAREYLLALYREHSIKNDEYALLAALTLGDKSELDSRLYQAFAKSGAMHILAVSGLHVGILYMVLNFLLSFRKKKKFLNILFILLCIWTYAFLTGLSPSVQRASIMFSFISLGKTGKRDVNIYNILALSALLILVFDPSMLFHVGFQFSFLAVAGILFFQPRIVQIITPKRKIVNYGWQLLSVSFAAQLSTFPLTLYYFHYFPSYFWLTNLFIIPLVSLTFCLVIPFIIFSFSKVIASVLALMINIVLKATTLITSFISDLPGSTINNLSISKLEVVLIFIILLSLTIYFVMTNKKWLFTGLTGIVVLIATDLIIEYNLLHKNQFIVYNIYSTSLTQIIDGTNNIIFTTAKPAANVKGIMCIIQNPHFKYRQKSTNLCLNSKLTNKNNENDSWEIYNLMGNTFIDVNSKKILLLQNDSLCKSQINTKLSVDKIVINNAVNLSGNELLEAFDTDCLIIDSSVPKYKAIKLMEELKKNAIKCHYAGRYAYIEEL